MQWGAIGLAATILSARIVVKGHSARYVQDDVTGIPQCKAGLVLGCSKHAARGRVNLYFKYRMQKATELYNSGKVECLIVSGDNHSNDYDEPTDMKEYLVGLGVPEAQIVCDYAGLSTLDSVVRAREVFGLGKFIVVSQGFHNHRAVFIGRAKGMELYGLNARDVARRYSVMTGIREELARVKAVLDVWILGREPKFLGKRIPLPS